MPKFRYTAIDLGNKKVSGTEDASDLQDLKKKLKERNLVLKIGKEESDAFFYRLKPMEVADFCRQMGNMLESGVTILRILEIQKESDCKPQLKKVYQKLYDNVRNGVTLSEALRMQQGGFPSIMIHMIEAGEASGNLENSAYKMAEHFSQEHRMNRKVQGAMMYPAILSAVTVLVVFLLFTIILPQFFESFASMDIELPAITLFVKGISDFLQRNIVWVIMGAFMASFAGSIIIKIPKVALRLDQMKLRIPVIGKLLQIVYTARFARTLASLYASGISMVLALRISASVVNNHYIESQFDAIIQNVRNGETLSLAIADCDGFEKKLGITMLIGEESGRLENMLTSIAESYDYEAEMATARMVQLVEPTMIVVMAVIVGCVMLSVFMPLMTLYQNMGSSL